MLEIAKNPTSSQKYLSIERLETFSDQQNENSICELKCDFDGGKLGIAVRT